MNATISSFGRSNIVKASSVFVHYTPPLSQTPDANPEGIKWIQSCKLCGATPISESANDYLDIDTYAKESDLNPEQITKIIDKGYVGTPGSFRLAVEQFRKSSNNYEWFIWIENDCLFRSNWFDKVSEAWEQARQRYKVGVIMPCRTIYPTRYGDRDINPDYDYLTRQVGASHCWVISREVMFSDKIDLTKFEDYKFTTWDDDFCNMVLKSGYQNIVLRTSCVKHIGKHGAIMNDKNWQHHGAGGLNFMPDDKIMDLYEQTL